MQRSSFPAGGVQAVGNGANAEVLFGENYARLQRLKQDYDPDFVLFTCSPITLVT
jgi:hypothetical protein